ncbi:MAG: hypothetical protein Q9200_004955 [Gallowayella weberi]
MASSLAKQPQHRQSTRSNSASSSVVTVQRAASTRNGSRAAASTLRSPSPNEITFNPANLSVQNISPDTRRRSSAAYGCPDAGYGVREGVANLNRWSQSTVSSSKSSTTNARRSSFSKRISGSFGSFGGFNSPQSSSPNGKGAGRFRPSANTSPDEVSNGLPPTQPPHQPPPTLPPIVTLSSLSQAVDAADSPSTAATATPATADLLSPLTYQPDPDYFGNRWRAGSPASQQRLGHSNRAGPKPSPSAIASSSKPTASSPNTGSKPTAAPAERAVSKFSRRGSIQLKDQSGEKHSSSPGYRGETTAARGLVESEESASASDRHERDRKEPSQKAMLSKALQKANHAVLLDNAQNFEGAMDAYGDACALLQRVMLRSSGDEDRKKLEAVRNTYNNRINELRNTDLSFQNVDGKALPLRPVGRDSSEQEPISPLTDEEEDMGTIDNATAARSERNHETLAERRSRRSMATVPVEVPVRRHSLRPPASRLEDQPPREWNRLRSELQLQGRQSGNATESRRPNMTRATTLDTQTHRQYMPPPLSPRRSPLNLQPQELALPAPSATVSPAQASGGSPDRRHVRHETTESTSWLDTIDESGGSSASSVHSRTSSIGLRRKRIRAASGATEAEFDAALDAAVEAAYDDGFEPANDDFYDPDDIPHMPYDDDGPSASIMGPRQNVELAKERVREVEREAAIAAAKDRERKRLQGKAKARDSIGSGLSDDEVDDEERMLEEMTRGYILDSDDVQSKSALPRQSDSSGFSGRTWGSSIGSNPTSAGTSMSMAAGAPALPSLPAELQAKQMLPPAYPPPSGALPNLPNSTSTGSPVKAAHAPLPAARGGIPGVRERRLSGIRAPQLKIETNPKVLSAPVVPAPKTQPPPIPPPLSTTTMTEPPKSAFAFQESQPTISSAITQSPANTIATQPSTRKGSSPYPGEITPNTFPPMPGLHKVTSGDSEDSVPSIPDSPARLTNKSSAGPGTLRKNFSSSSLKKMLTVSGPEIPEAVNSSSSMKQRRVPAPAIPSMPTPKAANFMIDAIPSGGMHLLDSDIHSPMSPGTPNPMAANAPLPLEPCPESTLLRPFWFLRCIYQSVTHPRGGYLSHRLFIPRDVWKVTNVKLKSVEEKVSSCDLLTATLLKLAKVDTFDANAVLEEMQFLESVMEQSQTVLSRKLGGEVGVGNAAWLSKGFNASGEMGGNGDVFVGKISNTSTKSYLSSWRKKMSKTSSVGVGFSGASGSNTVKEGNKEVPSMSSVPMTCSPHARFPRRDLSQVQYVGPHAHYMGALARLCDAAQILGQLSDKSSDKRGANRLADQIARGVEDPGLKHSSATHVGLELSARHAAEFFGFYICRFVLNDISMMLDKFIKRGSQWVLA